jgi:RND family efflux transporter MFP subunit
MFIAGAVALIAIVVFLVVQFRSARASAEARRQQIPVVKVLTPVRSELASVLRFTGDVYAIQQAAIFSKVTGNIERIFVDMGTPVKRGQVLALIDTTELAQQLQQAAATYENARLVYTRSNDLFSQNLVSRQDQDNAEAALKIARAAYDAARTRLGYAWITSPFKGYITRRFLDAGALVTPNSATLFTLMDLDAMKVVVNVQEHDIPLITEGKPASVTVDAFPGRTFIGRVKRYSQAVDLGTRTMPVEIDIPNPGLQLKPGMYATVTLEIGKTPGAITIPLSSLLRDNMGPYVMIAEQDTARRRSVTTGMELDDRVEIRSGLSGTEQVISTGQQLVRPNGPVTIQRQ